MAGTGRAVTLRDVARQAGVAIGTASKVFSGKPWVSEEKRAAVLAAAAALGYQYRPRGTTAPVHTMRTIGLITRAMQLPFPTNPFYAHVLAGAERACAEQGVSLLYAVVDPETASLDDLPPMVHYGQVQGLVVIGYFPQAFYDRLQQLGLPVVLLDHRIDDAPLDSVTGDDERGGYIATRYLLELGHRSPPPAIITGPSIFTSFRDRLAGYRRALDEFGLSYDEDYVRIGDMNPSGGYAEMNALLRLAVPPRAVFCCNDVMAVGAMNALHERGIAIGKECAVMGYDDIAMAAHAQPPLTTVRVDKALLGAEAVRLLLGRINGPDMAPRHVRIGVSVIERRSTAPAWSSHDAAPERSSALTSAKGRR